MASRIRAIGFNLLLTSVGYATLVDAAGAASYGVPFQGKYGLVIIPRAAYTLSQEGEIPIDARLLTYRSSGGPVLPFINGVLPPAAPQPDPFQLGALLDISRWAGQTVNLSFTFPGGSVFGSQQSLDGVVFQVPEPGTLAMVVTGGAVLAVAAKGKGTFRRSQRQHAELV